MTEFGDAVSD